MDQPDGDPTRKLTAILYADVAGYSRLTGSDELGTHKKVMAALDFANETISAGAGAVLRYAGDALLAEFSSVVAAVNAAVAIQNELQRRNADMTPEDKVQIRVGINIGEVLEDRGEIFGDGVNLAARLEPAAQPGAVCVSSAVYEQIAGKVDIEFKDGGEQAFKNIAHPVRIYHWQPSVVSAVSSNESPVSERPSIAVLPFDNMSGDREQDFLADGISEDLITALSKIRWFTVIARNTTFTYKGTSVDVKKVASDLDVRYVLEGSVRKGGNRIRITAQLIDAHTGHHVWAERYDRELDDIFDLQDEMSQTIVSALEPELSAAERERAVNKPPDNLGAWEYYQRGLHYSWSWEQDNNQTAIDLFREAQRRDPAFAPAYAQEAYAHYQSVVLAWTDDPDSRLAEGRKAADKALQCDDRDAVAYFASARIHMMYGEHDACIAALERSLELNPNFAQSYHALGMVLALCGNQDESRRQSEKAERLSPRDPILIGFRAAHSLASLLAGDYEESILWGHKVLQIPKDCGYWPHALIAAASAHLGRMDDARAACEAARLTMPDLTVSYLEKTLPTKHEGGLEPWLSGLRMAGLPE